MTDSPTFTDTFTDTFTELGHFEIDPPSVRLLDEGELFVPGSDLADRIAAGAPVHELRQQALERGMKTLLDDALEKARAGVIPLSEVIRAVPYRTIEGR